MKDILEAASKSIWKEVRDLALKKGTETLVAEGIKSVIEVVKRRRIRHDEFEFAEWKKAQNPPKKKSDKKDDDVAAKNDDDESTDESDSEEGEEEDDEEGADEDEEAPDPDADPEPDPES